MRWRSPNRRRSDRRTPGRPSRAHQTCGAAFCALGVARMASACGQRKRSCPAQFNLCLGGQVDRRDGASNSWEPRDIGIARLQRFTGPDFGPRRPEVEPDFAAGRAAGDHARDPFLIRVAEDRAVRADQGVMSLHRVQQLGRGVRPAAVMAELDEVKRPGERLGRLVPSEARARCRIEGKASAVRSADAPRCSSKNAMLDPLAGDRSSGVTRRASASTSRPLRDVTRGSGSGGTFTLGSSFAHTR